MLKRILVLDDNQDMLDVVKEALLYEQFEVKITSDSKDFIAKVINYRPDLLILDVKLNGPNGDDICRQIKTHHLLCNTPVIICSAYLIDDELLTCGCDATIAKPFGLEELLDKVNGLVCSRVRKVEKASNQVIFLLFVRSSEPCDTRNRTDIPQIC